jgi:FkbM family methyltransferase
LARSHLLDEALTDIQRFVVYKLISVLDLSWLRWLQIRGVLSGVLTKLSINCVLDVGANQGQYGLMLRGLGYKGWIVSFEPVRAQFEILEKTAARNGPWRAFPYALGSSNSRMAINVTESSFFSSFLTPREDSQTTFPQNRVERTEEVAVWRLDHVLETCISGIASPRIYLKLDTQGFDLEVLKGAEDVLAGVLALQTEVSFINIYQGMPGFTESIKECQARGFEVVDFLPVTTEARCHAVEMDCLMTRRT